MKIKPINQNVLVKPDKVSEKLGSIYIPETVKEKDQHAAIRGELVAMCDDAFEEMETKPKVGAAVYFARYGGSVLAIDGEHYRLMKDIDVTAVETET